MDRAFESGAVALAPTAPVTPSIGYPTGGNPVGGIPPTKPGDYWFHMITEELRAIVAAAGLTPDRLTVNQVLQALPLAMASRPEMGRVLSANGYQRFPGGLILQWGTTGSIASNASSGTIAFPIAFPAVAAYVNLIGTAPVTSGANTNITLATKNLGNFSFVNPYLSASAYNWLALGW